MHDSREFVSGIIHLIGAVLAFLGTLWMAHLTWDAPCRLVTVVIFGVSLILVYCTSAALHLQSAKAFDETGQFLQRCDHAAIYFLIAGTYTPFCYHLLDGNWRWGMLVLIWVLAGVGAVLKLFYFWQGHLSTLMYAFMGWLSVVTIPDHLQSVAPGAIFLIVLGGIIYTLGAVIFALNKPNFHRHFGHHELWHVFVIAGSACHFLAVMLYVVRH